ncbi:MAG: hypothetical protein US74_C0044G0011 [Parcubacteria group bacterium GW2011_GWA2_38_13]|nr:MAG: hypothetical protein US74_C0044G0011 [Parcubacteria group bacterium GW2011_GWA2_38_13]
MVGICGCSKSEKRTNDIFGIPYDYPIRPSLALMLDWNFNAPVDKVTNIPSRLRTVSYLDSDDHFYTFHKDTMDPGLMVDVNFVKGGVEFLPLKNFRIDVYATVGLALGYLGMMNDLEWMGTTGPYYCLSYSPIIIPAYAVDLKYKIAKDTELLVGVRYRDYQLRVEYGQHTYGTPSADGYTTIADIYEKVIYLGVSQALVENLLYFNIRLGASINDVSERSPYGNFLDVKENNPSVFGSLGLEIKF